MKTEIRKPRKCIHCGSEAHCKCKFKAPKGYEFKSEISNQSDDLTMGEMLDTLRKYFQSRKTRCTFKITVYRIGESK